MGNTRDRNIQSARRDDFRAGTWDVVEIKDVWPHVHPYPEGKDYHVVSIQLIDRVAEGGVAPTIERVRLKVGHPPGHYGKFQGTTCIPRIGDAVLVAWIKDREGVVMAQIPMVEQEPICLSQATPEHQEQVTKRSPWEMPERDRNNNFINFPNPKHPDCKKWWPLARDSIFIHDCPYGHAKPQCDAETPCNCLDDLQEGTWLKIFSDISPTLIDKPRRVKFHHHGGSYWFFDEDGRIYFDGQNCGVPKGHLRHYPDGTMEAHSTTPQDENSTGSRWMLFSPDNTTADEHGLIAAELINLETFAMVRIYKDGCIKLRSQPDLNAPASEIYLGNDGHCWLWNLVDDNDSYVEILADGSMKIKASALTLDASLICTGNITLPNDGRITFGTTGHYIDKDGYH